MFPVTSVVVCSYRILIDNRTRLAARNDSRRTAPVNSGGGTNRKREFDEGCRASSKERVTVNAGATAEKPANSAKPPDDPRLVQIVGRHFHFHTVTDDEADEAFAHFAGDSGEDQVFISEFDPEHRAGEHGQDTAFHLDVFFH